MGGWHLRMTWVQEVCYASLHSEPASVLWQYGQSGGMARYREMSTLPSGYIPQCKVTSTRSSESLSQKKRLQSSDLFDVKRIWTHCGLCRADESRKELNSDPWSATTLVTLLIVYQDGNYLSWPIQSEYRSIANWMIPPSGGTFWFIWREKDLNPLWFV